MTRLAATVDAPAIELAAVHKVYRERGKEVHAVQGLDLRVERGEVFGLLGPNGAGKTTTVELCEGLLQPTSGEVRVLGLPWRGSSVRALRARIGVALQSTKFFEKQTVRELLRLFCSVYDEPRSVDEVLGLVALEPKQHARFASLSGGQRQRLAVACALVGRPDLLFLDEPTTGLDPQARRQLWDVVRDFRAGGGTVVLTTHYMEEASALCDRIMVVDGGRSIAAGTPAELVAGLGAAHVVEVHLAPRAESAPFDPERLRSLPAVRDAQLDGTQLNVSIDEVHRGLPSLLDGLDEQGAELLDLRLRTTTLEDVFVHLTGRHLRDEEDGA